MFQVHQQMYEWNGLNNMIWVVTIHSLSSKKDTLVISNFKESLAIQNTNASENCGLDEHAQLV